MKQLLLFSFLIFYGIKFVGSDEQSTAADEYHGNIRQWTIKDDGKLHIALHILKDPTIKLVFPKEITFDKLLSDLKLYSPGGRGHCKDLKVLNFTLKISAKKGIYGEIKVISHRTTANLFEKCGDSDPSLYAFPLIDSRPADLENEDSRRCFENDTVPFQVYISDNTKNFLELQTSGTFECQVFLEIVRFLNF
uniref:Uncharacterized protein n=1 Tax=Panagrolaimus superbus TaxID=310955 RepID=A0A914YAH6_9BILA